MSSRVPMSSDGLPCPFNLFAIFQTLNERSDELWIPIPILEIQPGDILVYQPKNYRPPTTPDLSKPTGTHAVIVKTIINLKHQLQLKIIDCTRKPHNMSDTRYPDNSGIGTSDLFISYGASQNTYWISWNAEKRGIQKELFAGRLKK